MLKKLPPIKPATVPYEAICDEMARLRSSAISEVGWSAVQVQGGKGLSPRGRDKSHSRLCLGTATVPNSSRSARKGRARYQQSGILWLAARREGVART